MCGERAGHTHFFRAFAIILSGQNGNEIAHISKQYEKIVGKMAQKKNSMNFTLSEAEGRRIVGRHGVTAGQWFASGKVKSGIAKKNCSSFFT